MDLIPYIYHELQEKNGSMLCEILTLGSICTPPLLTYTKPTLRVLLQGAQHALNNLLQQHIYSEVDLADLAAEYVSSSYRTKRALLNF
jgi:hypothetical protein